MKLSFHKYQGTGNDFVIVDNRQIKWSPIAQQVSQICDRKMGVGADGLILIQDHDEYDFEMIYFNSDGSKSLCGNGSRCAIHFANHLEIIDEETNFLTTDGVHKGRINSKGIHFEIFDVHDVQELSGDQFINTGSPHYLTFRENIETLNIFEEGSKIRYDNRFSPDGTNVNFIEITGDQSIWVRTYERGVEDETLSCGTGVTAAALGSSLLGVSSPVAIKTLGGQLSVSFKQSEKGFKNIYLSGPAAPVFQGTIEI